MTYGGAVSLTGLRHGADVVSLESKTAASPSGRPRAADARRRRLVLDDRPPPRSTTQYRLAWGDVRAGLAKIAVAPRVDATVGPPPSAGRSDPAPASPARRAAPAAIRHRLDDGLVDGHRRHRRVELLGALPAGTYRVRCAPGQGLAAGVSRPRSPRSETLGRLVVLAIALVAGAAAAAFENLEPLAAHQWYLDNDRAWTFWPTQPQLFSGQRRRDRLGDRRDPSGVHRSRGRGAGRSSAARRTATTRATGRSSRERSPRTRSTARGSPAWPSTHG